MERISRSTRSLTTGVDTKDVEHWLTIYIMGRGYRVPADLTIMTAMEFAGYKLIRSCGCRQGFCGACATVFRRKGEYKLDTALACQTRVEDGMSLVQIPFVPAEAASYDVATEEYSYSVFSKHYPEVARCVSCNTCTKACPQDLEVMDYVQAAIRGDFKALTEGSFDCIQCGLCAIRCPAEIVQYHVAQLGRRMYGRHGSSEPAHLRTRLEQIEQGEFDEALDKLVSASRDELEKVYASRERESDG
ncbi:MAG: 4Fe-4S dicluster domain-containing protein [Candidatus Eisenbacteria bacterium]|nr:4Fe-4S dicluster domain-containing protein [Candidatus Eisenbacteria bacterium]